MNKLIQYPHWFYDLLMIMVVSLLFCPGCRTTQTKIGPTKKADIHQITILRYRTQWGLPQIVDRPNQSDLNCRPTGQRKGPLMNLHEIIVEVQDVLNDAIAADEAGDLKEAYEQLDKLHDLLVEEFVPMEHP